TGFSLTSTMRTRPRASRCESLRSAGAERFRLAAREPSERERTRLTLETAVPSVNRRFPLRPMSSPHHVPLPVSTRHAFASASDLAVRRDAWHSLILPLLLRAPWILAIAVLSTPQDAAEQETHSLLTACALVGDFLMLVLVGAMLRFRAKSVFGTPL